MKRIRIRQRDVSDCGAACLSSVCSYYGRHLSVAVFRQWAGTGPSGTTLLGMQRAAGKAGLEATAVRCEKENLSQLPMPAILHVIKEMQGHYVVLVKIRRERVIIMDPADGKIKNYSREEWYYRWSGIALLVSPGRNFIRGGERIVRNFVFRILSGHRQLFTGIFILALVYSICGLAGNWYIREMSNGIFGQTSQGIVTGLSAAMLVIILLQGGGALLKSWLTYKIGRRIDHQLIMQYFGQLLKLPYAYLTAMRTGELISRVQDVSIISQFISQTIPASLVDLLTLLLSVLFMCWLDWKLALVVMSSLPFCFLSLWLSNYFSERSLREIKFRSAALETMVMDTLHRFYFLKVFSLEALTHRRLSKGFDGLAQAQMRFSMNISGIQTGMEMLIRITALGVWWLGTAGWRASGSSPGEIISFYVLASFFAHPALSLLMAGRQWKEAGISADRLLELLTLDAGEPAEALPTPSQRFPVIRMADVGFAFPYQDHLFREVSFELLPGKILGIAGASGTGKSTLIALLLRLYDPVLGIIYINDISITAYSRTAVRNMMAVVPQETVITEGSIAENIMLSNRPDENLLYEVMERTMITDWVDRLPEGRHTRLLDQGIHLSGGQRQCLSIARALYRNAPLLILDEPTNAMDEETEFKIMQTIEWYKSKGNSVILISHSESAMKFCDNIVTLKNGRGYSSLNSIFTAQPNQKPTAT